MAEKKGLRNFISKNTEYNTRPGTLELRSPKLREGSYFPSFPEACRLSEKALNAVIQEAWINGKRSVCAVWTDI